jgi:hypothetical protein
MSTATRKLRVYIAGAYGGPDVITIMGNMRRGLALSADAAKAGYAVYSPWTDCLLHFLQEFTLAQCYAYSMPFLEVCDAVLVVPENIAASVGAAAELTRARELGIPVFWSLEALQQWERDSWTTS